MGGGWKGFARFKPLTLSPPERSEYLKGFSALVADFRWFPHQVSTKGFARDVSFIQKTLHGVVERIGGAIVCATGINRLRAGLSDQFCKDLRGVSLANNQPCLQGPQPCRVSLKGMMQPPLRGFPHGRDGFRLVDVERKDGRTSLQRF